MRTDNGSRPIARPQFLRHGDRRLFTLGFEPAGDCIGSVLYLPPFAEEMNRCRSHVAGQARALAGMGLHTMLLDPCGTGESDGRFEDATWQAWVDDAVAAARALLAQRPGQPLTLWGLRTGALLAADVARALAADATAPVRPRLLLWQPVVDGKLFLNQYLRLRIASQMVAEADRETTDQIRSRLAAGEVLEVAGYPLTGAMADRLAAARLDAASLPAGTELAWLEVVAKPEQPLGPASRRVLDALNAAGHAAHSLAVACPMVWQIHERVDAPELLAATRTLLQPWLQPGLPPQDAQAATAGAGQEP